MDETKVETGQIIQTTTPKKIVIVKKKNSTLQADIKKRLFIKEYVRLGNATDAYIKVYKTSRITAQGNASKLLKSIDISDIMDAKGITDNRLLDVLDDGLKATRPYGKDAIIHADNATRHSYMVTGLKLKKRLQDEKQQGAVMQGLQIVINQKK